MLDTKPMESLPNWSFLAKGWNGIGMDLIPSVDDTAREKVQFQFEFEFQYVRDISWIDFNSIGSFLRIGIQIRLLHKSISSRLVSFGLVDAHHVGEGGFDGVEKGGRR